MPHWYRELNVVESIDHCLRMHDVTALPNRRIGPGRPSRRGRLKCVRDIGLGQKNGFRAQLEPWLW
jgi:hypothetical protein